MMTVKPKPTDPVKTRVTSLYDLLSTGRNFLGVSFIKKTLETILCTAATTYSTTHCHCTVLRTQNKTALESKTFQMEHIGYWPQTRPVGFPHRKQLPRLAANSSVSVNSKSSTEAVRGYSL